MEILTQGDKVWAFMPYCAESSHGATIAHVTSAQKWRMFPIRKIYVGLAGFLPLAGFQFRDNGTGNRLELGFIRDIVAARNFGQLAPTSTLQTDFDYRIEQASHQTLQWVYLRNLTGVVQRTFVMINETGEYGFQTLQYSSSDLFKGICPNPEVPPQWIFLPPKKPKQTVKAYHSRTT